MRVGESQALGGTLTLSGLASALERAGSDIDGEILNVVRRGQQAAQAYAVYLFRSQGIGRRLFGQNDKGAFRIITRMLAQKTGDGSFVGGIKASGLAAMQDAGGRTKAHVIMPLSAKNALRQEGRRSISFAGARRALGQRGHAGGLGGWPDRAVLQLANGRYVRWARHPGSNIHVFPFMAAGAERALPGIARDMEQTVTRALAARGIA